MQEQEGAEGKASAILVAADGSGATGRGRRADSGTLSRRSDYFHARLAGDLCLWRSRAEYFYQSRGWRRGRDQHAGDTAGDVHDGD